MDKRIYLCLAHMSGNEQKYIQEAFDTNWVVPLGPNVNAFEEELEQFVGENKKVVALSAGTAAVHLALIACGVKAGDEVLVQSFTFCASSHPVTYLGATPVFVDSEPDTWNMDPVLLEHAIEERIRVTGRKPKAIVPVYLYGMPAKIEEIMRVADKYGIPVIEHVWPVWRLVFQWQQDDYHVGRRCVDLSGRGSQAEGDVLRHAGARVLSVLPARGDRV